MRHRTPIVGVMGGHKVGAAVIETAYELGALIAQRGWILLNGGRNAGVMAASARGAKGAGGTVVGILPGKTAADASPDLDIAIPTGLGDGRNLINVYASHVVVALPGALGTLSEVIFALKNRKPVILLGLDPGSALDSYRKKGLLCDVNTPQEAVEAAAEHLQADASSE